MFLLYLIFFLFSLGQIGRISFLDGQVNVYWYELGMAVWVLTRINPPSPRLWRAREIKEVVYFLGYIALIFLLTLPYYTFSDNLVGGLYLGRLILYFGFFITLLSFTKDPFIKKNLQKAGLWMIGFIGGLTILQYFLYPDLRNLWYQGWDPHLYRVFGTFFEPVILGSFFGLTAIWIKDIKELEEINSPSPGLRQGYDRQARLWRAGWIKWILMGLSFIVLLLTYARGVYIAFFVTAFLWLLWKRKWMMLGMFVGIFAVGIILLPRPFGEGVNLTRLFTIESRVDDYKKGIEIWNKNPVFGIGYNRIRAVKQEDKASHAAGAFHSSYLTILVTGGVVGLALFILFLFQLTKMGEFGKLGVIFLSIVSLFDNVLLHPFILFSFLVFLTLSVTRPLSKSP